MDCLLECSYHLQMHTPTAVDPLNFIERFQLGSVRSVCKWDIIKWNSKWTQMNCITMHKCTEMYLKPDIQNLDNLRAEPESSLRRRDEKLNADSEGTSSRVSHSMKDGSSSNVCTYFVELSTMKVNLKVFCTLLLYYAM